LQNLPENLDKLKFNDIGNLVAFFRTKDKSLDEILRVMERITDV